MAIANNTLGNIPTSLYVDGQIFDLRHHYDIMNDSINFVCDDGTHQTTSTFNAMMADRLGTNKLISMIVAMHTKTVKSAPEYRHPGPSNRHLENPAIAQAWQELQVMMRLCDV